MPWTEAFLRNLDWDHVNRQLAQAEAAKEGPTGRAHRSACRSPADPALPIAGSPAWYK
jgi:hypothetical protein